MSGSHIAILVIWVLFWIGWLGSAFTANASRGSRLRGSPLRAVTGVIIVLFLRLSSLGGLKSSSLAIHSPVLITLGMVVLVAGLGFAVWARVHLGRNWGMPMTERAEPELITSGPYTYVRHPIYSGLVLAALGTAVAINLIGVLMLLLLIPYFLYSATVEERNLTTIFPSAYPEYRKRSKMLVPFVV